MFLKNQKEWENIQSGEHPVLFFSRDESYPISSLVKIKEQKAPYIIVADLGQIYVHGVTVYVLSGIVTAKNATVIALGGNIEMSGNTTVYVLDPVVNLRGTGIVYAHPNISHDRCTAKDSRYGLTIINSPSDWEEVKQGEEEVIICHGSNKTIEIDVQKAPHIIQISGRTSVKENIKIFAVGGEVQCRGGTVFGYDFPAGEREEWDPPLSVELEKGYVCQFGGELKVRNGCFKAPYLEKLVFTPDADKIKGEAEIVDVLKDFRKKGGVLC